MVLLRALAFAITVMMVLTAPTHHAIGVLADHGPSRELICPRRVAAETAKAKRYFLPVATSANDCEVRLGRPWTVQCASYCGSELQQQIYAIVVINGTCSNITSVVINTTTFSVEKYVNRSQPNAASESSCGRPFISGLFAIPGNFCGANASILPDITVTLLDSCGSRSHCCQADEVRVVRFIEP